MLFFTANHSEMLSNRSIFEVLCYVSVLHCYVEEQEKENTRSFSGLGHFAGVFEKSFSTLI